MSEKFCLVCDSCKHISDHASLLLAQIEAERHGSRANHLVRVYLAKTEQVGSYEPARRRFVLLERL